MKSGHRNGLALMRGFLFWLLVCLYCLVIILAGPVVFIFVFCLKKVFIYQIHMFPYLLFKHKCPTLKLSFSILNYTFFGYNYSFCFAEIGIFFACKAPSQVPLGLVKQTWCQPHWNQFCLQHQYILSSYCQAVAYLSSNVYLLTLSFILLQNNVHGDQFKPWVDDSKEQEVICLVDWAHTD